VNTFEKIFVEVGKGIKWPFKHGAELISLLETEMKDEPEAKIAVCGLIKEISAVTADGALAASAKGLDVSEDIATLTAARALYSYVVNTFLPAVESIWKDVAQDLSVGSSPAPAAPAPTSASVPE
jgi:hypothetical protein